MKIQKGLLMQGIVAFFSASTGLLAQTNSLIPITSAHNAVVLQVGSDNRVSTLYFGAKINDTAEYRFSRNMYRVGSDPTGIMDAAYTPSGSRNLEEPAIEVTHADGNTSLDLQYLNHNTTALNSNVSLTTVLLRDPVYAFEVQLNYKVYNAEDVIEQWAVITNKEKRTVNMQKFASANLYLRGEKFWLKQYHGDWAKEMRPEVVELTHGIKVLDSKLGTRAHLYEPPSFMVSVGRPATEDEGQVLLGTLAWSGNFRFDLEVDPLNNLRLIAGVNSFASEYALKPNQSFETPAFVYTFSNHGTGEASRQLHRWARQYRVQNGNGSRMTLLNNWESTFFDFNEPILSDLIKDTKTLGVDVFLLDDGWFGNNYPRNSDNAGLGDWQENVKKLPHGIGYLVKEAEKNNVKFGIWIEPEMVNPKSDLYNKHPDWVIKQPNREEHYYRNQLVLDLSNPKVQDFVFGIVDNLFTKNPGLAFIKWDCNAVIFNAYSAYLDKQSQLYVDYVKGLYKVLERVRAKFPEKEIMLCSGGGGRVDYGALKYFDEFWLSDNTDPLERIFIQYEYSYFFPAIAHSNHVTDWGKQPIKYRTDVAMMGKLGFDIVVNKLPANDLLFCQQAVKTYDSIKNIVWHGDLYRLADPRENDFASLMYANSAKDSAVMFNYITNSRFGNGSLVPVKLKGLDAIKKYTIRELNLYPGTKSNIRSNVYSGEYLMTIGYNPGISANRSSVILAITETK